MFAYRSVRLILALVLTAGFALLVLPKKTPTRADDVPKAPPAVRGDQGADSVVPVATDIRTLRNVEWTVEKEKVRGSIHYAFKASGAVPTVILLPVFAVAGQPELQTASPPGRFRPVLPDRPLLDPADQPPLRLRVQLASLLAEQKGRESIEEVLKKVIGDREGVRISRIADAVIDWNGFRMTLCASGTGSGPISGEVSLSQPVSVPPKVAEYGGEFFLELLPEAVAALQEAKGRPVTAADLYLRIDGAMRAEFHTTQYTANVLVMRRELTGLQTRLGSIAPSAGELPEAFVQVAAGGSVQDDRSVESAIAQYAVGEVSVRSGQDPRFIQELTERVLARVLEKVRLAALEDSKRVAVLLNNQVAVSATVGQIRTLSSQTQAQREKELRAALDDTEARRRGETSEYKGSLGIEVGVLKPLLGFGGSAHLTASAKKAIEDAEVKRRTQTLETVNRGFDELRKHFSGAVPTLTGIRFAQKGRMESEFTGNITLTGATFERGWSQHQWPALYLTTVPSTTVSPRLLAEQLAVARTRYEAMEKQLEISDARFRAIQQRVAGIDKDLERPRDQLRTLLDGADKRVAAVNEADARINRLRDGLAEAEKALARIQEISGVGPVRAGKRAGEYRSVAIGQQQSMRFAWCPPGTFLMGSPGNEPGRGSDETWHWVTLTQGYWLGLHEVTQAEWREVMGNNPSTLKGNDSPVENVSWNDCQAFCRKLGEKTGKQFRLPTEAEWEYACRAGTTTPFHFGETISTELANYDGNYAYEKGEKGVYRQKTTPLGSFPANAWGFYDMHGNVGEWCQDWYGTNSSKAVTDPQGSTEGSKRVLRGGSWRAGPWYCRSAYRTAGGPAGCNHYFGCRVVLCLDEGK